MVLTLEWQCTKSHSQETVFPLQPGAPPCLNLATGGMVRRSAQAQHTWAQSHSRGIRRCRSCYDRETTAVLSTMRKELPKITDFFSATSGNVCESAERGVGPAPVKQSEHRVRAGSPTHTYFTRMSTRNTGEACLGSEDPRCIHFLGHTPPPHCGMATLPPTPTHYATTLFEIGKHCANTTKL